jgi:predicted O-linked N-acetylglucosamine transferase (SPINDLY family)
MTRSAPTFEAAVAAYERGDLHGAQDLCRALLAAQPAHFEALGLHGIIAARCGNAGEALLLLGRAAAVRPADAGAHYRLGAMLQLLQRYEEAVACFDRAISIRADHADALVCRGDALADLGRFADAVRSYDRALQVRPGSAETHYNRGVALQALGRAADAVAAYDGALALNPNYAKAHVNRGNALTTLQRVEDALQSYALAVAAKPDLAEAYVNRAVALVDLRRFAEAVQDLTLALRIAPQLPAAHFNLGVALQGLDLLEDALRAYDRAIAIRPDYPEAFESRGHAFRDMKRYAEAAQSYAEALQLNPGLQHLVGVRRHLLMHLGDWRDFDADLARIAAAIAAGRPGSMPFPLLALVDSASLQRRAAEIWIGEKYRVPDPFPAATRRARAPAERIRIGYFSANFEDHPVARLMAEVFEKHDRSRFELIAFSLGRDARDAMRRRIVGAFDRFLDVRGQSNRDIARHARDLGVDVAVDLGGFTDEGRIPGVFSWRAAPLQVGYIGYLGTIGADFMDYLIADPVLIPALHRQHYSEHIIYLPSYQANDAGRVIAERGPSREELGLPERAFVFCCFNAGYKITPRTFDGWMRILGAVAGSVLLLYADDETVQRNLRGEAERRGVAGSRLVFAGRLPPAEYLARYRAADLFLDTLPYNAGTTASDALWAGLPVLTCMGETLAARMAASLLTSLDLTELIAATPEEFERVAVALATESPRLAAIRAKLAERRLTAPLFDSTRFVRCLESAYAQIFSRHQEKLPPADITVG